MVGGGPGDGLRTLRDPPLLSVASHSPSRFGSASGPAAAAGCERPQPPSSQRLMRHCSGRRMVYHPGDAAHRTPCAAWRLRISCSARPRNASRRTIRRPGSAGSRLAHDLRGAARESVSKIPVGPRLDRGPCRTGLREASSGHRCLVRWRHGMACLEDCYRWQYCGRATETNPSPRWMTRSPSGNGG